jgi:hypothetical protein
MTDTTTPSNSSFIPFNPFNSGTTGVSPQGFDFAQFAQQLAGQAAQALPGLIMGLLTSHPTVGPLVRAQGGVSPQSLINLGMTTPTGTGGFNAFGSNPGISPQGFDFGQLAHQVAGTIVPMLPGLIMSILSANPAVASPLRTQGAAPTGVLPQGFDISQLVQQLAGQAVQALPGLIMGLLSAHPIAGAQVRAQGVAPQSLLDIGIRTPFGGGNIGLFGSNPGVSPQGFDLNTIAQQLVPMLPGLIMSVFSNNPALGQQLRSGTVH